MYAELHTKTNFSFLEGASHPDELVGRAAELGYGALAVTDRESLAGVVRAHVAAKETGLKLLIGRKLRPTTACRWSSCPPIEPPTAAWHGCSPGAVCGRRRGSAACCKASWPRRPKG